MRDKVELLDTMLLEDTKKLKEIDHWLKIFNWPNGWHYDLDIVWVLQNIEKMKLSEGATIVDAGAGLGMTQFILASRGYNIISLDFTERMIPKFARNVFKIHIKDQNIGAYTHEYMEFMKYGQRQTAADKKKRSLLSLAKMAADPRQFNLNLYRFLNRVNQKCNIHHVLESAKGHERFGTITFLRGTFNSIPLENNTADALVSVSAFEHNTYEDMPGSIKEFNRVLKMGSAMFITTSATENDDWYFKPPKAWNFSSKTLSTWFNIPAAGITFDYRKVFDNIVNSKTLRKRLSPFYKCSGENGLPYGNLKEIKYLPVGIAKFKE